jgi:hypothetical protein
MALLTTGRELPTNLIVNPRLRVDEAFEVEQVRYLSLPSRAGRLIHAHFHALLLIAAGIPLLNGLFWGQSLTASMGRTPALLQSRCKGNIAQLPFIVGEIEEQDLQGKVANERGESSRERLLSE